MKPCFHIRAIRYPQPNAALTANVAATPILPNRDAAGTHSARKRTTLMISARHPSRDHQRRPLPRAVRSGRISVRQYRGGGDIGRERCVWLRIPDRPNVETWLHREPLAKL